VGYVAWDIFLFIFITHGVVLSLAGVIYAIGGASTAAQNFKTNEFMSAYIIGLFILSAITGILGLIVYLAEENPRFCCLNNFEGGFLLWTISMILLTVCGAIVGSVLFFAYFKRALAKRAIQSRLYLETSTKIVKDRSRSIV
jgi:uncharacterized membrane protein YdjX (TVP38/TMEM64 family)